MKTEVLVCPVYDLHEFIALDNRIRLLYFHVCLPVFPPCAYNCCIMDHTYHSHRSFVLAHLHHYTTFFSRTLTALFFKHLLFPSRSCGMPLLALIVSQTLRFCLAMSELISHYYENCLDRCEEKWVWKLWGQWTSRRSQLFM